MSGKGSGRRNEDADKVRSNWGNIDWSHTRDKAEDKQQDTEKKEENKDGDNK
jgi:hypothetical protein